MFKWIDLFHGTEREESASDTPDEVGFAWMYFAYYPYLTGNA